MKKFNFYTLKCKHKLYIVYLIFAYNTLIFIIGTSIVINHIKK